MGGETELTLAMAVVRQWCLILMAVAVDGGSGNGIGATAVGKDTTTMQWWQR
jgi:hypothetical protein